MEEDLNSLYYFTQVVEHHGFAAGRASGTATVGAHVD